MSSFFDKSHIWHGDPTMDAPPRANRGSKTAANDTTTIWQNNQANSNPDANKIQRIELTLRKIAQLLQSI